MIPVWEERPVTVAHLLNPAFCGEIIRRCSQSYSEKHPEKRSLPFPLCFITMPLVLHKDIRNSLPKKTSKNFIDWVESNQMIKVEMPQLTKNLVPYTREAIMFLMKYEIVGLNEDGEIDVYIKSKGKAKSEQFEVEDCFAKAELVGRWFANLSGFQSIYTSFGIKP